MEICRRGLPPMHDQPGSHASCARCSLMAVGFGDAGAEIIADNMRSGGDLNPMVPGQKVTAIFGFCDVRQFTDTTEILQVLPRPCLL